MKKGSYTIMAAQFFSSLVDNALFIAAIALLTEIYAPQRMTPLLKLFFALSYVLPAAFVGAFADSHSKGKVMLITSAVKLVGYSVMLTGLHPLLAYGVVDFGVTAYPPAKYGIPIELLPPEELVAVNGWIEGLTVGSIILGTMLGEALISNHVSAWLLSFDTPGLERIGTPAEAATLVIMVVYLIAALSNTRIPDIGARYPQQEKNPIRLVSESADCLNAPRCDRLGQISLAVTTLFWGADATLQFIVLKWAEQSLELNLSQGAILQAVVAVGMTAGVMATAVKTPLCRLLDMSPVGVAMDAVVMLMAFYTKHTIPEITFHIGQMKLPLYMMIAYLFLMIVGAMSGFFVVSMNTLLQHRGHALLSAGHSTAVQNFNENVSVLLMLCLYALLIRLDVSMGVVIVPLGIFVCLTVALVVCRHRANEELFHTATLIGEDKHH